MAAPVNVGWGLLVTPSLVLAPVSVAAVSAIPVGIAGAVVSITTDTLAQTTLFTLPSVAIALTAWLPSLNALEGVNDQAPLPSAVVAPTETVSTYTVTVLPAWAVPINVGCTLRVMPSEALLPVSLAAVIPVTEGTGMDIAIERVTVALFLIPSFTVILITRVAVLGVVAPSAQVTARNADCHWLRVAVAPADVSVNTPVPPL